MKLLTACGEIAACSFLGFRQLCGQFLWQIATELASDNMVIKAQVLAGGRGLGTFDNGFKGGVHVGVKTPAEIKDMASKMLGSKLITKQTGAAGRICNTVQVVETVQTKVEKYFAILMDRKFGGPVIVASAQGGVTIEDIAAANPDAIIKEPIDIKSGLAPGQAKSIAEKMKFTCAEATAMAEKQIEAIYDTFIKCDCTMVEVNPLTETPDGKIVAVDAKVNFDDNAEFRQKAIHSQRDTSQVPLVPRTCQQPRLLLSPPACMHAKARMEPARSSQTQRVVCSAGGSVGCRSQQPRPQLHQP